MSAVRKTSRKPEKEEKTREADDGYEMIDEEDEEEVTGGTMSLTEHLAELRSRLISCLVVFFIAFALALWQASPLTALILSRGKQFSFVYISPAELMMNYIRIALVGGVVAAVPVIIYQVWQFLQPGLRRKEKRFVLLILTLGLGLFILGAVFAFEIALPIILDFFARLDTTDTVHAMVSVQEFISYFLTTMITFGVIFECPILVTSLVGVGLVTPNTLQSYFKYVVLIIFTLGAVITPPDVTSQILVSVPLMALYEISILLSRVIFARRLREEAQEE